MDPLTALRDILLGAVPTFLLVWLLHFYTTRVFFRPLQETLKKRREATSGLREAAEAKLAAAEQRGTQYEEALRAARAELYRRQEQERLKALEQRTEALLQARRRAEQMVGEAKQEIARDVEGAKIRLAEESEPIARTITRTILEAEAAR